MWLVVAIAGCGPARFEQPADTAGGPGPTPTETGAETASSCPWVGEWDVGALVCAGDGFRIEIEEATTWAAAIEPVAGEPDWCRLLVNQDGCFAVIELYNPNEDNTLWDGRAETCFGSTNDLGVVRVGYGPDGLWLWYSPPSMSGDCTLDGEELYLSPPA